MKYALIGCGRIATNHIAAALNNELTICAVCDIKPERASELLCKHGLQDGSISRYEDYKKMLSETNPDIVAIATESGKHAEIALYCINMGCNVIIEKPIALSIQDANEIIQQGKQNNVKVCACHQNRFNISIQHIRSAMEAGRFGRLSHGCIHVRWNRGQQYYTQAPWRGTWEQDGGALMNQSIHGIDLLCWMMGNEIEEVTAYTAQRFHSYLQCEDVGLAIVKFKNGALGTIEGTTNVYPKNLEETLYIFGEKGSVKAGGKSTNTIELWDFQDYLDGDKKLMQGFEESTQNVYGNGHTSLYYDMMQAIKEDRAPYISAHAGKQALEVVLAIYKSAAENRPVKFPLTQCSTMDFQGRFD